MAKYTNIDKAIGQKKSFDPADMVIDWSEVPRRMTIQEAIETLEVAKAEVEWNYPLDYTIALDMAIKAMNKQIAKKPLRKQMDNGDIFKVCPCCGDVVCAFLSPARCNSRGQMLDWKH